MGKLIDLKNKTFGRLLVTNISRKIKKGQYSWNCICACGKIVEIDGSCLRAGKTKSCGCLRSEITTKLKLSHGKHGIRSYIIWKSMKARCLNSNVKCFKNYGGRGITICKEWENFSCFYKDMGNAPIGLTLDRINNDLGYSKENCRWATKKEQSENRRQTSLKDRKRDELGSLV